MQPTYRIGLIVATLIPLHHAGAQLIIDSDSVAGTPWAVDISAPANNRSLGAAVHSYGVAADDATRTLYRSDNSHRLIAVTYGSSGAASAPIVIGTITDVASGQTPTMQGLAFDSAAGKLYGVALGPGDGGFYEISTDDASCTLVRALPGTADFPGFDYNPSDDSFYVCTNLASSSVSGSERYLADSIYRFHKPIASSVPTLVASSPAGDFTGLAAIGNLLYLTNASNSGISAYDMFTGSSSTIPFTWDGTGTFSGATWAPGVLPTPNGADVSVTIACSAIDPFLIPPGGSISYTIRVKNNGPNTSGPIILQDTLPTGMTFGSASPGTWSNPSGSIRQTTVSPLANGASATYTLVATPTVPGTYLNKVYANNIGSGSAADPRVQNNRAVWSTVARQPGADLVVSATSPAPCSVSSGGTAVFSFSLSNRGDIAATNTSLSIALPTNVTFLSSDPPLVPTGGTLVLNAGSLVAGAATSMTVSVIVDSGRAAELTATASSSTLELNPGDNTAAASVVVPGVAPLFASISALYSTVQFVNGVENPTSIVPGLLNDFDAPVHFLSHQNIVGDVHLNPGRPYANPSGSKFIQFWDTDHTNLSRRHILLVHDLSTGTGTVAVQSGVTQLPTLQGTDPQGGPYTPFAISNLAAPTFNGILGINDAGSFAFTVQDSRVPRSGQGLQAKSVIRSVGGVLSLVAQQRVTPAPPPYGTAPNANVLNAVGCAQIASDDTVAFVGTNLVPSGSSFLSPFGPALAAKSNGNTIVSQGADTTLSYPAPGILGSLSVWSGQSGGTSYPMKTIFTDPFYNTTTGVFYNADHSRWIMSGILNTAPFASSGVIAVDGQVVLQGGQVLPGFSAPVAFLLNPSNFAPIAFNGNYRMEGDGTWFITGRNTDRRGWAIRNGTLIARGGETITPNSTERWADGSSPSNPYSIYWACGNPAGDHVVYGHTNNPWTTGSGVIVLNGTSVLARTGDPVDLNANGLFDDGYYMSSFGGLGADGGTGEEAFLTSEALYVLATVQPESAALNCGSFVSSGYALVRIPLPTAYCPADFNGDGGVDGADIEAFFIQWEAGDTGADVNLDGGIDGADIESFFLAWEAGGC